MCIGHKNGTASAQKNAQGHKKRDGRPVPYGVSMIVYRRGGVGPPVTSPALSAGRQAREECFT